MIPEEQESDDDGEEVDHFFKQKQQLVTRLVRCGDKQLLENASKNHDWTQVKHIKARHYSFKLEEPTQITQFLKEEGVDSLNKETHDRNTVSVINTLGTVKKLSRLFMDITKKKKHKKTPLKDLYVKKFGSFHILDQNDDNSQNVEFTSSSSSVTSSSEEDDSEHPLKIIVSEFSDDNIEKKSDQVDV